MKNKSIITLIVILTVVTAGIVAITQRTGEEETTTTSGGSKTTQTAGIGGLIAGISSFFQNRKNKVPGENGYAPSSPKPQDGDIAGDVGTSNDWA